MLECLLELECLLDILGSPFIAGMSETWLRPSNKAAYSLPGYSVYSSPKQSRSEGGVTILVKGLVCNTRQDLSKALKSLAGSIFIEVNLSNCNRLVVFGEIYRSQNLTLTNFIEECNNLLLQLDSQHSVGYLMEDFNIDLLRYPMLPMSKISFIC